MIRLYYDQSSGIHNFVFFLSHQWHSVHILHTIVTHLASLFFFIASCADYFYKKNSLVYEMSKKKNHSKLFITISQSDIFRFLILSHQKFKIQRLWTMPRNVGKFSHLRSYNQWMFAGNWIEKEIKMFYIFIMFDSFLHDCFCVLCLFTTYHPHSPDQLIKMYVTRSSISVMTSCLQQGLHSGNSPKIFYFF